MRIASGDTGVPALFGKLEEMADILELRGLALAVLADCRSASSVLRIVAGRTPLDDDEQHSCAMLCTIALEDLTLTLAPCPLCSVPVWQPLPVRERQRQLRACAAPPSSHFRAYFAQDTYLQATMSMYDQGAVPHGDSNDVEEQAREVSFCLQVRSLFKFLASV